MHGINELKKIVRRRKFIWQFLVTVHLTREKTQDALITQSRQNKWLHALIAKTQQFLTEFA
jgi:hypothetical protein